MRRLDFSEQYIRQQLEKHTRLDSPIYPEHDALSTMLPHEHRPAAVLIPLLKKDGAWHILLTRRNSELPEHSGQVAFPGGRVDPEDNNPERTALREAYEEIGLKPEDVRVLGRFNDYLTISNYQVTPVVGVIPWPYAFRLAPDEVSKIFTIPLEWLADPAHYEVRERKLPPPFTSVPVVFYQPYEGEILWGVSARLVLRLLEILLK